MLRSVLTTVFSAAILIMNSGARADETDASAKRKEEFVNHLFAGPIKKDDKSYACFVRVYDAEHLARHPKQKVRRMKLLVTAEGATKESADSFSFRLGLNYRNKRSTFDSSGGCNPVAEEGTKNSQLSCYVDCDGGGIGITLANDDKVAMLEVERIRIWRNSHPDEEASYSLEAGQDDHIFRLERVDTRQCASLVTDREELAAMRKKK